LAGAILSDRFCCVPVYGVPLTHESKREDFLFFVFFKVLAGLTRLTWTPRPCSEHDLWEPLVQIEILLLRSKRFQS
jgi:hypothetical protein